MVRTAAAELTRRRRREDKWSPPVTVTTADDSRISIVPPRRAADEASIYAVWFKGQLDVYWREDLGEDVLVLELPPKLFVFLFLLFISHDSW